MGLRLPRLASFFFGFGMLFITPSVQAVITAKTPLKAILTGQDFIFMVTVEKLEPERPALVLKVEEDLKGKIPFRQLAINLKGDSTSQKEKQSAQLVKRLALDLPLVMFSSQSGDNLHYTGFAYTNGTWFQVVGEAAKEEPARIHWGFTHCEPYLRRTFKGTTAEMRQTVLDGLTRTKAPPEPDLKEQPGLGPEIQENASPGRKTGARIVAGPMLAVIPVIGILGPLAFLAMLFPAVFGGVLVVLRRWQVLLTVASTNSTLFTIHLWFRERIQNTWWGSSLAFWITMAGITLAGALWAWRRYRVALRSGQAPTVLPRRSESIALWVLSLAGLGIAAYCLLSGGVRLLLNSPWKELLVVGAVAWLGALYILYVRLVVSRRRPNQPFLPAEVVMLGGLVFACLGLGAMKPPQASTGAGFESSGSADSAAGDRVPAHPALTWTFEPKEPGHVASSPLVEGDRVYVAAALLEKGFNNLGRVYCLDLTTGHEIWHFDEDGRMKQVFSSPCLANGLLYVGEGFHQDSDCKFFCLDAATGKKRWDFPTTSHTESSPCVASGRVFFGAGDDGVYGLDAATGKEIWHFRGLHVDTSPAVIGNRLFGGSGYGDHFEMFCLDTTNGMPRWRQHSNLPVFASPTPGGDFVYYGIGNGDFLQSAATPAGALVCLSAQTGNQVWRHDVADGVHGKPAVDKDQVYFCSRDHNAYCLDRKDGSLRWQQDVGSPVLASSALVGSTLYLAASGGRVCCLGTRTGQIYWSFDVAENTHMKAQLLSSPRVAVYKESTTERHQIFFGAGLDDQFTLSARLFCIQDEE